MTIVVIKYLAAEEAFPLLEFSLNIVVGLNQMVQFHYHSDVLKEQA